MSGKKRPYPLPGSAAHQKSKQGKPAAEILDCKESEEAAMKTFASEDSEIKERNCLHVLLPSKPQTSVALMD